MKKPLLTFLGVILITLPTYSQVIPVIGIKINNTETAKDDYVNTSYIICKIQLFNGSSFSGDILITLRNISFSSGGQVLFSSTGGSSAGSTSLNLTLYRNNSSTTFYIKGRSGYSSNEDKDAIIEVMDNRTNYNSTVLARKALMVTSSNPLSNPKPQIEIQINSNSTLDDYVTWSPTSCSIRLANYQNYSNPVSVTLRNMSTSVGSVNFASSSLSNNSTATYSTLNLSLPNSGTWVKFFISGKFTNPSLKDKDAIIEVIANGSSTIYTREPLMVRVRKNANNLSSEERQRYLNALTTLNSTFNNYQTFYQIHSDFSSPEAHNGPGFLAWHRAFLLNLERQLQTIDPGVTIPYWKFDYSAPNLLSTYFMGSKPSSTGDSFADVDSSNPLVTWNAGGEAGIRRTTAFANSSAPSSVKYNLKSETATVALGSSYSLFRIMETNPHGYMHNLAGSTSGDWISTIPTAVKDPLFFFLHSNLDRIWAKWQWVNDRFDANSPSAYSPQGAYPGSGTIHIGHYLTDTMWPWNGVTGTYNGSGTIYSYNRPSSAPGGPLTAALSISAPSDTPQPFNMIDYKNNRLLSITNGGMGFCYDDIPFQ